MRLRFFVVVFLMAAFSGYSCDDDVTVGVDPSSSSTSTTSPTTSSGGTDNTADDDGDGLGNSVETRFDLEEKTSDTDHDGFGDGLEFVGVGGDPLNSAAIPSPARRSRLVDPRSIGTGDADDDGLSDNFESDNGLDPESPDSDDDGYSDALELVAESDPCTSSDRPTRDAAPQSDGPHLGAAPVDVDRDGLADAEEARFGGQAARPDSDGDGFADGIEMLMGSRLDDPFSIPSFTVPDCTSIS